MIPLNQTYRIEETLRENVRVRGYWTEYKHYLNESVQWIPHDLHPSLGRPGKIHVGRSYDAALAMASINFTDLKVLELGARASFLGCYLTAFAAEVHVSDLFQTHDHQGSFSYWQQTWEDATPRPQRLFAGAVDMRKTLYRDDLFDVVLNISAIEHVPGDGDTEAMVEMARIVKPGGFIVIGTDISDRFRIASGKYYDERALYERLIEPSGCHLHGPSDLSWEGCDQSPHKSGEFERSACLFVLRKGER